MKLATYKDGSRDGHLVVVASDLATAHYASDIATRLQQVLDDWNFLSPQLEDLARNLNHGRTRHAFAFDPRMCMAPLPRAYQWVDASAYPSQLMRLRNAHGAQTPESLLIDPMVCQRASDDFLGPCDDAVFTTEEHGIDFEGEIAAVTGDTPMGCSPAAGIAAVRLLMLLNDVTLGRLSGDEVTRGFGPFQSKAATAFGPVAVTPEELGPAWRGGRVHLALESHRNGQRLGRCDAGAEAAFHFGQLVAHLCKTRNIRAGSIVGAGTVSNGNAVQGCACIAQRRAIEILETGAAQTEFLRFGDRVRIEMKDSSGQSVFGAIEQRIAPAPAP